MGIKNHLFRSRYNKLTTNRTERPTHWACPAHIAPASGHASPRCDTIFRKIRSPTNNFANAHPSAKNLTPKLSPQPQHPELPHGTAPEQSRTKSIHAQKAHPNPNQHLPVNWHSEYFPANQPPIVVEPLTPFFPPPISTIMTEAAPPQTHTEVTASPRFSTRVTRKSKRSATATTATTSVTAVKLERHDEHILSGAGANITTTAVSTPEPQDKTYFKEGSESPRTLSDGSKASTGDESITTAGADSEDSSRPKISLPPIGHVLQRIDAYQNEQKLQDSALLLNFKERTNSEYSIGTESDSTAAGVDDKKDLPTMATFNAHMDITFKSESPSTPTSGKLTTENIESMQQTYSRSGSIDHTPQQHMSVLNIGPDLTKAQKQQKQTSRHSSVGSQDSESGSATPNSASGLSSSSSKKRTNLPRETIEILNEWVLNNLDNPYPNHTQKRILLEKTGLSNVQLSNWFINKRRRRIFSNLSGNQGQPIKKKRLIDRL